MLKSDFPCWLKVVDRKVLCRFAWNHYSEGLFLAAFLDFSLKQSALQRTMVFQIGFVG